MALTKHSLSVNRAVFGVEESSSQRVLVALADRDYDEVSRSDFEVSSNTAIYFPRDLISQFDSEGIASFSLVASGAMRRGSRYRVRLVDGASVLGDYYVSMPANDADLATLVSDRDGVVPSGYGPQNQGAQGQFYRYVFRNGSVSPPALSGGSYVVATGVLTAPAGSTLNPTTPGSGDRVYASQTLIDPAHQSGTIVPDWSGWFVWHGGLSVVSVDGKTIVGDGLTSPLKVPAKGISNVQLGDGSVDRRVIGSDAVDEDELVEGQRLPSAVDGQTIERKGAGWVASDKASGGSFGGVSHDGSLTGTGLPDDALGVAVGGIVLANLASGVLSWPNITGKPTIPVDTDLWEGAWVANRAYAAGKMVSHNADVFMARVDIPDTNTDAPVAGASWWQLGFRVSDGFDGCDDFRGYDHLHAS